MSKFFDGNSYFIDENVNFFKFENTYKVFNDKGEQIGAINQKLTSGQKILRLLLKKAMLPFLLEIKDVNNETQATISRGWTFFLSKITLSDSNNFPIAIIKQKFKFFTPTFMIYDMNGLLIAEISGDWTAWNFTIKNLNQMPIGIITKKWAGAMKEIFTTADKYNVVLSGNIEDKNQKIAILSAAITIDMVLKESK